MTLPFKPAAALCATCLWLGPVAAQPAPDAGVDALYDALALEGMVAVMRVEGLDYGAEIAEGMFDGRAPAGWSEAVSAIYDAEAMQQSLRDGMAEALDGAEIAPMIDFFADGPGRRLVALELSAREALLDEDVEAAAREAAALAMAEETPRFELVDRFVEANDLIEANLVGALNANYAFSLGLLEGGGFDGALSEDEILLQVWSQEEEIRRSTTEWVYSFLNLAYQPAEEADLEAYIAFSETATGGDLNRAMFEAFDAMFSDISRDLGRAAAAAMAGQDI
ncbi:DUF2059 domain-containing protein [Limimaricola pyoseonensis]|uniref:Uncharacterized protein n=1 Tax=Limimaricola pyoseonensis TaxID=521013 RepID=A0A1G7A2V7_9RHOB|nr:DUF2059 domain-containing protein [Limimaricola pyoseonensis]SDE08837.1 hypothetical protein SAMN04488567_0779 [Limimaricola pyoseonensis]